MAQSGYTPILIYASGTAAAVPLAANLTSGSTGAELALNYTDGKLYYKDNAGVVQLLASSSSAAGGEPAYFLATMKKIQAFELAYQDVKKAFEYYLEHYNNGRPIIIASHSKGSTHTIRLLKEFFDGKQLKEKLVMAYLIILYINMTEYHNGKNIFLTNIKLKLKQTINSLHIRYNYERLYCF